MKQSIIEILKVRVDERGVKHELMNAMDVISDFYKDMHFYINHRDSIDLETRRKTRVALIGSMKKTQALLWELQLILGIDDLEKQTEDFIEWQELQSIPH